MIQEKTYYNYLYAHPLTGNIFYVGKGHKNRLNVHLKDVRRNKLPNRCNYSFFAEIKSILSEDMEPIIMKVAEFNNEEDAYQNEKVLIQKYKDEGHCLYNLTDGGDGFTSDASKEYSNRLEVKNRVSNQSKKRWADPNFKKTVSKKIGDALRNNPNVSNARKKRWVNGEYRKKMGNMSANNWENKEYRDKLIEKRKIIMMSSEYKLKMSNAIKLKWQDPTYREMMIRRQRNRGVTDVT